MVGSATVASGDSTDIRMRNSDGYILKVASKRSLKENINEISSTDAISFIKNLTPVSFQWKNYVRENAIFAEKRKNYKEYGFIAEDVALVSPDLASYDLNSLKDDIEPSNWQANAVISVSVAALKTLIFELESLKTRVQALESQP